MKPYPTRFRLVFLTLVLVLMHACSHEPQSSEKPKIITISKEPLITTLFYTGVIRPLKTIVVPSPAEGVIIDMPFPYGEKIKKNDLLFMMSSTKFLADYKLALMQYVKAKSDFVTGQTQLTEAKFLHSNQLISDDEFKMKQSNFYTARLNYLQSKDALQSLLQQLNIKNIDMTTLTIADIDKITQVLHSSMNSEKLPVFSPAQGILLSPNKNEDDNKKIAKGDNVKQGDALAVIGDMSGLRVRIKVNELNINQLKVGQKIKVTGIAFPNQILNGEIESIDHQGEASTSGLPTFLVEVIVSKLSQDQLRNIHVGMSAKVEINIREDQEITIPLAALTEHYGESYVKLYDEKKNQTRDLQVKTGKTTLDSVTILTGLKEGDKIVIPG